MPESIEKYEVYSDWYEDWKEWMEEELEKEKWTDDTSAA